MSVIICRGKYKNTLLRYTFRIALDIYTPLYLNTPSLLPFAPLLYEKLCHPPFLPIVYRSSGSAIKYSQSSGAPIKVPQFLFAPTTRLHSLVNHPDCGTGTKKVPLKFIFSLSVRHVKDTHHPPLSHPSSSSWPP